MPAVKTKRISTLIETQLPQFISTEYELFSKFMQKYYEAQEVQGGTLDVINNLQKYADIDFYEKNILKQNDVLASTITDSDTTIVLQDAQSFPKKNGYVRIDDEIIFYATRTDTELRECSRGVSGNSSLGDLYESSTFTSTEAAPHNSGQKVYNVSNLFLYAFVKNFEKQYLGSFPEKYLRGEVDKRTLIKNIQKFYKSKGTTSSIKFIFNSIVAEDVNDKPEVYKPKDFTYKSSNADWINVYALKCKVVSGNVNSLVGKQIVQEATNEYGFASAIVDNLSAEGTRDGESIVNIVVAPETVNGEFAVSTKTSLTKSLSGVATAGNRIDVFSTLGWDKTGSVLIGNETITFEEKTATQFIIKSRQASGAVVHPADTSVYKPVTLTGSGVTLLILGVVYNVAPTDAQPHASVGDKIQVSEPGFLSVDPKIVKTGTNQTRWILGSGASPVVPTLPSVQSSLLEVPTDVTTIHEDDQYYYITSSSFPSHKILDGSTVSQKVLDQKILRLIRKRATATTERYQTPKADTGILLNGVRTYSYRDTESVRFGRLEEIKIDLQGRGYAKPPFVLIDEVPNKARAVLAGQVVESIIVDTEDVFPKTPTVTITSGRRAEVRAVVTGGKVTSLIIDNPGEYYSSPPIVRIRDNAGRGRFASYNAIVDGDGKLVDFEKIDEGNFYNQNTVIVDIIAVGEGAVGIPLLKEWNFNRYEKLKSTLDTENGYIFQNYDSTLEYGYGYLANPKALRVALNDNLNNAGTEPSTIVHSPIIGFAYDGNPIYGPFGHQDPLNPQSSIVRMTSGYSLKNSRSGGPSVNQYTLGSFIDDYQYVHRSGSLDENNGRFCVTPEFPNGTYAYFVTIDSSQVPQFPYILGANFYSLPVDSNYNSDINQNDIPKNAKRYNVAGMPRNGEGLIASISDVSSGTIDNIDIVRSSSNFSVNSKVYFNNQGTEGSEVEANVSSVKGKGVSYLQSKESKVVKLTTVQTAFLFADDTLRQPSSNASGTIVGTVSSDNVIVLKNVVGTFDNTGTFSADIKTFSILVDQNSSYTEGAILSLTNGVDAPIATGEVLEGTNRQNVVKIKVLTGTWIVDEDYFIQSSNLFNTIGSRIVTLTSLSDGLEPFEVNQSVALIETDANHGLGIGDSVNIDINPDDTTKTKTYYLRKRIYQEVNLIPPSNTSTISFTGIGRFEILNGGADYTPGTYTDVKLTGGSGKDATASFTVSSAGIVSNFQLQNAGSGYARGDYISVADESLVRSSASLSTARFTLYVGHVGVPAGSTKVSLKSSIGFAVGDLITIGEEICKINSITDNDLFVSRGQENTADVDHFDGQEVSLYKPTYNFDENFQIFSGSNSGYIQSYDRDTQKIVVVYDYATELSTANLVTLSSSFFESSSPSRLVSVKSAGDLVYKFEFSEDNTSFTPNPNINIQEFYKYKFDTSHSSLTGTYFDLSPSRNYNIETLEKTSSTILPGNAGSFTDVKFGFGARLSGNTYQTKVGTNFSNFYYFDRKGIVNSEGSYLKIVQDPLQGVRTVNYVTPNRFVYDISSEPLWDGSGSISYTTTGQFAIGEINSFAITNLGLNYKKLPVISGVDPNQNFRASATVLFDITTNTITGINLQNKGSNYVNPKVVITNGDGVDAKFNIVVRNGEIFSITVDDPGIGYTFAPEIIIVEGDVEAYTESVTVGVPRSVSIINNGGSFHLDKTVASTFSSKSVLVLSSFNGDFRKGETVVQRIGGTEVARAKVSEWRFGSNLLKVENILGTFRENVSVQSIVSPVSGIVKSIFVSTFAEEVTGFYDNLGFYKSDRGRIGNSNQKIVDSFFYQDYSYVVKSKTPVDQWRELIKSTTHPAGFKLFGQVDVEATASTEMPAELPKASHFSIIQLSDKVTIESESTRRTVTQILQKVENQRIRKGQGSAATSEFLFNEMRAFEVKLAKPFDGVNGVDAGKIAGSVARLAEYNDTQTFELINDLGQVETKSVPSGHNIVFYKASIVEAVTGTGYSGTEEQVTVDLSTSLENWDLANNTSGYSSGTAGSPLSYRCIRSALSGNGTNYSGTDLPNGVGTIIYNNGSIWPQNTTGEFLYNNSDNSVFGCDFAYLFEHPTFGICFAIEYKNDGYYDHPEVFPRGWKSGDVFRLYVNGTYSAGTGPQPDRFGHIDFKVDAITLESGGTATYTGQANNIGTKEFQLLDENNKPFTPYDAKNLIVTLDGVLQEPGVSYTVQDDKIIFSEAPLGPSSKQTGESPTDVTLYNRTGPNAFVGTTFYAKYVAFKDNQYNNEYFKKIRNIFQRNGRWLDAANQVERNRQFIVEETIGYAKTTYPTLDWSTKQDDYEVNIGSILDAYEHDLRFGGNIKTIDYTSIFNTDSDYLYIQNNRSQSTGIFKYAARLAKLAIRNWDYTDAGVVYIQGSRTMTVTDTDNLAIGMFVSSGRAFPSGTYIVSIDSDTQVTLSRAALANSSGGGGVPAGTTLLSGTATDGTLPTSTGAVKPPNEFNVPPGVTVTAGLSFAGTDQATFSWSGINNGTFYDAANLIAANKKYIQEETLGWAQATYPSISWGSKGGKCQRDLGFLVDAYVYHLRFGGNEKVVEFGQLYYVKAKYPESENLLFINKELDESLAAFEYAKDLMVQAMRNTLGAGTYTSISPVVDNSILVDSVTPYCAEVESALDTYDSIVNTILSEGKGLVTKTNQNPNKPGNWSRSLTYSNYNIIGDPLLLAQECNDVISSVDSLTSNIDDILQQEAVTRTLPDYIDGETKEFELYWEDGSEAILEEDEDLFLTINAVLQRPKYTENFPLFDAYFIDRTVIPNVIKFDVAPIWDQDFGAKTIGEPTAVEKIVGVGVGNYKRLTIDYDLVDGIKNGPFLILDVEDNAVQNIESEDNLYVFLDGVLQRKGYSYTISGPNIYFNVPIQKEMKIDMRYLYGRDVGQVLNIYDFAPDTYYSRGRLTISGLTSTIINEFGTYAWMGDKIGSPIHLWQQRVDGTFNVIGEVSNFFNNAGTVEFDVKSQNGYIIDGLDFVFAVKGRYDIQYSISDGDITSSTLSLNVDDQGRKLLKDDSALWKGTVIGKSYRNPFVYLANGDKIRVEGEEGFRSVKQVPPTATSKDGRNDNPLSNEIYSSVSVETYTGVTRGEGLSIVPIMEKDSNGDLTGKIERLEWNQRSYDPLTQPTAYQYYTPPIIKFIPKTGKGGGARANVLVSKGQVISVDLIDGGSGYEEAPTAVVSRRFDILSERDIGVSIINIGVNPYVETAGVTVTSTIDLISFPEPLGFTTTAVIADSPTRVDWELEEDIQLVEEAGTNLSAGITGPFVRYSAPFITNVEKIDVFKDVCEYVSIVSTRVEDITSASIVYVNELDRHEHIQITTTLQNVILNDAIDNVNFFEVGAYLQVDLDAAENIIYIADTSKFKSSGYLLIGDEVVFYYRKLGDRFIKVQRGKQNTTPQDWSAGTFLRQIPDPVSVAFGGVVTVESGSEVSMVSASAAAGGFERKVQRQISAPDEFSIARNQVEIVVNPPETGFVDRYIEEVFFTDEIPLRNGSTVQLATKDVTQRNGNVVLINNFTFVVGQVEYRGDYVLGKLGPSIGNFGDVFVDSGFMSVSGIAIGDMDIYYPALTIGDFTERHSSSYMKSGRVFRMVRPSINNPVTHSAFTGTIPFILNVNNTTYFPDSGHLFTANGTVISYTSKSNTTFNSCTVVSGPNTITSGDEVIPFAIN